jgi:2-polyprenyl-3-methyl-5-hydroxy-6-metoxy-1,4-benzoquinol methylase
MLESVKLLYERRPYPHYPILAKPQLQNGYLGSSRFAFQLAGEVNHSSRRILSIGCGEILPFVIQNWEDDGTPIDFVDLSMNSLFRAQFRNLFVSKNLSWYCTDIGGYLGRANVGLKKYEYVEAYGVLHHIPDFSQIIAKISDQIQPGGLFRVMFYNSKARTWIWHINRAFRFLEVSHLSDESIEKAQRLLFSLGRHSRLISQRLAQVGLNGLKNKSRFADTFLHPWESRNSLFYWLESFRLAGFEPVGLLDRYGELDDLPNPLWKFPTIEQIQDRVLDYRFENNFEIWFKKGDSGGDFRAIQANRSALEYGSRFNRIPNLWLGFKEVDRLDQSQLGLIWKRLKDSLNGVKRPSSSDVLNNINLDALRRLARLGGIAKRDADDCHLTDLLMSPICKRMDPPKYPSPNQSVPIREIISSEFPDLSDEKMVHLIKRFQKVT